jgi:hypothetical protein
VPAHQRGGVERKGGLQRVRSFLHSLPLVPYHNTRNSKTVSGSSISTFGKIQAYAKS